MDPVAVLSEISISLGIVDKIADQFDRFRKNEPDPPTEEPHSVYAERHGDSIQFMREGRVTEEVTAEELALLDEQSQQLIAALERSMSASFALWTAVYPQRDQSPDPLTNAKVKAQLDALSKSMCGDLGQILGYLESLGKNLQDHYAHIRYICADLTS
jgi:hypothetical protein